MKFSIFNFQFSNSKKGFSIFMAVIVTGILTIIAFAVSNLSTREISLANLNAESNKAIFAANAGIECALFWDSRSDPSRFDVFVDGSPISCDPQSTPISTGMDLDSLGTTTVNARIGNSLAFDRESVFAFSLNSPGNQTSACAVVIVYKNAIGTTKIFSYGYNTCDASNPRRVERGIDVNY